MPLQAEEKASSLRRIEAEAQGMRRAMLIRLHPNAGVRQMVLRHVCISDKAAVEAATLDIFRWLRAWWDEAVPADNLGAIHTRVVQAQRDVLWELQAAEAMQVAKEQRRSERAARRAAQRQRRDEGQMPDATAHCGAGGQVQDGDGAGQGIEGGGVEAGGMAPGAWCGELEGWAAAEWPEGDALQEEESELESEDEGWPEEEEDILR